MMSRLTQWAFAAVVLTFLSATARAQPPGYQLTISNPAPGAQYAEGSNIAVSGNIAWFGGAARPTEIRIRLYEEDGNGNPNLATIMSEDLAQVPSNASSPYHYSGNITAFQVSGVNFKPAWIVVGALDQNGNVINDPTANAPVEEKRRIFISNTNGS